MAERDSWATQASGPTGTIDVEDARLAIAALAMPGSSRILGKSGFRPGPGTSPGLVSATGTPDGFVHVAPFQLLLQSGRGSAPGMYLAALDATKDINILSTPADATNPRNDLVIAQQSDTFYGDGSSAFEVKQVVGTPAASPADPSVSGSGDHVTLARVRVDAGVTTITGAKITDLRTTGHAKSLTGGLYSVALGGLLPVASKAERDALSGLYSGLAVWRQDLLGVNLHDGSGWRYFVRPTDATVATVQTQTSTSYTDLTTAGPAVTVETGTAALVTISAAASNSGANYTVMSVAVSGATTIAASDVRCFSANGPGGRGSVTFLITGLTPGSNTFTAKYKVSGGTGTWSDRNIIVEPR